jgi:hypothetical protein
LLSSDIFPTRLKFSAVKPSFKKGDRLYVLNCRPISLLTASFKLFEKIIYERLYQHLSQNDIPINEQYRFRSNSSTELAFFQINK